MGLKQTESYRKLTVDTSPGAKANPSVPVNPVKMLYQSEKATSGTSQNDLRSPKSSANAQAQMHSVSSNIDTVLKNPRGGFNPSSEHREPSRQTRTGKDYETIRSSESNSADKRTSRFTSTQTISTTDTLTQKKSATAATVTTATTTPQPAPSAPDNSASQREKDIGPKILEARKLVIDFKAQLERRLNAGIPINKANLTEIKDSLNTMLLNDDKMKDAVLQRAPLLRLLQTLDTHIEKGGMPWVTAMNHIDELLHSLGQPASTGPNRDALYTALAAEGNALIEEGDLAAASKLFSLESLLSKDPAPPMITIASSGDTPLTDEYLMAEAKFLEENASRLVLVFDNMPPNVSPGVVQRNMALPKNVRALAGRCDIIGADDSDKTRLMFKYREFEQALRAPDARSNIGKREKLCAALTNELLQDANALQGAQIDALMNTLTSANPFKRNDPGDMADQLSTAIMNSLNKNTRANGENRDDVHLNQAKFLADIAKDAKDRGKIVVFITTAAHLLDNSVVLRKPDGTVTKKVLVSSGIERHLGAEFAKRKLATPVSLVLATTSEQKNFSFGPASGRKEVDAYSSVPSITSACFAVPSILLNQAARNKVLKPAFPFTGYRGEPAAIAKTFEKQFQGFFYGAKDAPTQNKANFGAAIPAFGAFLGRYGQKDADKPALIKTMKSDPEILNFAYMWNELLTAKSGGKISLAAELRLHPQFEAINELVVKLLQPEPPATQRSSQ